MDRIVLAYSGSLDTSIAIRWLAEKHRAEIVTVTMDLGQGRELDDVRERALAIGAVRAHVLDLREEFARDVILPALQARATSGARCALSTALGRPLIAKHLVEIARIEDATAIAHGCSGNDKDQVRLEAAARALDPSLQVIAPARIWKLTRAKQLDYARQRGIPLPASIDSPYSTDSNLWGRVIEVGASDDLWQEPREDLFLLTKSPADAPDMPAYVEIEFERGVPVKISGVEMSLVELITCLETIAGAHGIGRCDVVDTPSGDTRSRQICEAPAAMTLHVAHRELQNLVTPPELERLTDQLGVTYADLIDNGRWHSAARDAIDALVAKVQERVTGVIRLKFFKGDCRVVGRQSPHATSDAVMATAAKG